MREDIVAGAVFPDYELTDHTGKRRELSELQGPDPMILVLSRGGYCLLLPFPYGIESLVVAAFVMHPGIVCEAKGEHLRILHFDRSEIVDDWLRQFGEHDFSGYAVASENDVGSILT